MLKGEPLRSLVYLGAKNALLTLVVSWAILPVYRSDTWKVVLVASITFFAFVVFDLLLLWGRGRV